MAHPLDSIREKLKRAEENIKNLNREIDIFLDYGIYRSIPDDDVKALSELLQLHFNRSVPLRLSVLVGEIIHQLRSTLDHLAWQLSSDSYRISHPTRIEFPIYIHRPDPTREKDEVKRYNRKVEGFSLSVKTEIERLQPYNSTEPRADLLAILHKMDVTEKHQELLLVVSAFEHVVHSPMLVGDEIMFYAYADVPMSVGVEFSPNVKVRGEYSAQIAFAEFGILQHQPVMPSLTQLLDAVRNVVVMFECEF